MQIREIATCDLLRKLEFMCIREETNWVNKFDWSSDSVTMAIGSDDGSLRIG